MLEEQEIRTKGILEQSKVIAIVGLSPDTEKASNIVATYLIAQGYEIVPVNPGYDELLGRRCYPSLAQIPQKIDIVDIFMRPDRLLPTVSEAITLEPKAIWLQLGIKSEDAKQLVEAAGIMFFMDVCIKQEHTRLFAG